MAITKAGWSRRFAGCRPPLRVVLQTLEVRARHELPAEVLRVANNGRDVEPVLAEGGIAIVMLGQHGVATVWHAVLAQEPRQHARGDYFQAVTIPLGFRPSLHG